MEKVWKEGNKDGRIDMKENRMRQRRKDGRKKDTNKEK